MKQRSAKKMQKWKERFERERQLRQEIRAVAPDILRSKNFRSTRSHVQHGNMTVNDHSMNVAKYSLAISEKLHIPCEKRDLIRGALLHDYFLYDWHTPDHISFMAFIIREERFTMHRRNTISLPEKKIL
jgi:uncharacterized protein